MVLPALAVIPLWLFLEIRAGHRALAQGAQPLPLFSKRKNWLHRMVGQLLAALIIAFFLRTFFIAPYRAETDASAPEIPRGSHLFVWKLAHDFAPGDIIAYHKDNFVNVGRVAGGDAGNVIVNRNGEADTPVPRNAIIGKVVSVYWRASNNAENDPPLPELNDSFWWQLDPKVLEQAPNVLVLRPTRFAKAGGEVNTASHKRLLRNWPLIGILGIAYSFDPDYSLNSKRIIAPPEMPKGNFDLMLTLTNYAQEALQREIKRQFGLVARQELRGTNEVLMVEKVHE
jgi:signal peptidase I